MKSGDEKLLLYKLNQMGFFSVGMRQFNVY